MALYIKNCYKCTILENSNTAIVGKTLVPEYLMGTAQGENLDPTFVSIIYSPPDVQFQKTSAPLINNLKLHSDNYSNSIILADLNANLLSTSSEAIFIYIFASELCRRVVEHGPTHFARSEEHTSELQSHA